MLLLHTTFLSAQNQQVSIPYFSIISPNYLVSLYQEGDGNYSTALFGGDLLNALSHLFFGEQDSLDAGGFDGAHTGTPRSASPYLKIRLRKSF